MNGRDADTGEATQATAVASMAPPPDQETIERWREAGRKEWSDPEKVAAWARWAPQNNAAQKEATERLLVAADLAPGLQVLDIGGGPGDPALAVAKLVGPTGHVTVTDIAQGMVAAAEEYARQEGLTNLSFQTASGEDLPFPDGTFDRVTCRHAAMFFADLQRALGEIRRVLRPGGRAAFLVWGPYEQVEFFQILMGPVRRRLNPPPFEPGGPHPFRFGESGSLSAALKAAGFRDVAEEAIRPAYRFAGSPETLRTMSLDLGGVHRALADLPAATREEILDEILDGFRRYTQGDEISVPTTMVVAYGVK